jgi:hypothetical protein
MNQLPLGDLPERRRRKARDEIWDTMVDLFGDVTNDATRGRRNRVVKLLRQSEATPDEMVRRFQAWPFHFPGATLTDIAFANHWDELGRPPLRATRAQMRQIEDEIDRAESKQRIEEAFRRGGRR